MAGATLDPLNPQSEYSGALLNLFQEVLAADPEYVQRLQRHYKMFKSAPGPKKQRGANRKRVKPETSDGA